ncbi:hypothetical protein [Bosea sp. 2RAB26]|uniref:hypothetical protein n=1 Tax=Bosea sp. 2RAB26 TaxID=3237476 RepID=UPI003F92D6A8
MNQITEPFTVTIHGPKADGFDRVLIVKNDDDACDELVSVTEDSATVLVTPER